VPVVVTEHLVALEEHAGLHAHVEDVQVAAFVQPQQPLPFYDLPHAVGQRFVGVLFALDSHADQIAGHEDC
jgi:hypothetical protein